MRNGELSSHVSPSILLIFEGAVGYCTDARRYERAARRLDWEKALRYWDVTESVARRVLFLYHRKDVNFQLVTYLGEGAAHELAYWADRNGLPFQRVWDSTPRQLARDIVYMPEVAYVCDPEPQRWLTYGGKGRFLRDVNVIGEGL